MRLTGAGALGGLAVLVILVVGATAWAEQRVIELAIRGGELAKDKQVLRVRQGDEITLRWTTDQPLSIHLHGYDIENKLSPGRAISMQFTARAAGRFPIEIHPHGHGQERTVGYLEVHPR